MIVINGRFLLRPRTGVERFAENIVRELLKIRGDIRILTPPHAMDLGVPTTQIGRLQGHMWEQTELPLWLARHGSPLLVNLISTAPALYRRQVVTHHDITYIRHPQAFSRTFRAMYRALVPTMLRRAQAVLTVSEFSRREIASHYGVPTRKIAVIPNAADARFSPGPPADGAVPSYFLAVSSPHHHKNFSRLAQAFLTRRDLSTERLLIVGTRSAGLLPEADLPDDPRILFTGRVTDDELISLYRGAVAFVFPSLYEGFGIPPVEAQSCGTPVVAARAGALPETLGDSALYVSPYSVADIARGLKEVEDGALRARLITAGFDNAGRYSWKASAQKTSLIIDRAMTRSHSAGTCMEGTQ